VSLLPRGCPPASQDRFHFDRDDCRPIEVSRTSERRSKYGLDCLFLEQLQAPLRKISFIRIAGQRLDKLNRRMAGMRS
jgi:hypothetical protein